MPFFFSKPSISPFSPKAFEMASSSYPNWMQSREGHVGFEPARVSLETSATLKKSRTSEMTPERPKWLPNDWRMEVRIRTSGKTAGMKDRVIKSL